MISHTWSRFFSEKRRSEAKRSSLGKNKVEAKRTEGNSFPGESRRRGKILLRFGPWKMYDRKKNAIIYSLVKQTQLFQSELRNMIDLSIQQCQFHYG
jgi:hypothetical protein